MSTESQTSPIDNVAGWQTVTLANITTKIGSGATPRGGAEAYLTNRTQYALVRSQNVFDRHFSADGLAFISDEQASALRNAMLQPDDVLLNITGDGVTFGRSCIVPSRELPACVNQHVSIIRADPTRAHPHYILAYLTHPNVKSYIDSFNAGGSRRAITKGHIESFRIPLPPLGHQRAIASILGALDDKIDLNRRTNETLEAMARAIFKSWFVDFDPVRAKMEGREPTGMDAETAALFPSRIVQRPHEVPDGWDVVPLDSVATFLNGLALQKFPANGPDSLPVIKIAEMKNGISERTDRASMDVPPQYIVQNGDVLFSWSGSLAVVVWTGGPGALNQHLFKVTSPRFPKWFYLEWVRHHLAGFQAIAASKATTMGHIQRHHLTQALVVCPSEIVLRRGTEVIDPLLSLALERELESRKLAALRDLLLPRLLSGELRIRDAERIVEAAP